MPIGQVGVQLFSLKHFVKNSSLSSWFSCPAASLPFFVLCTNGMATPVIHNAYSPKEATELCGRAGVTKANMPVDKIFFSSVMAGAILAVACGKSSPELSSAIR